MWNSNIWHLCLGCQELRTTVCTWKKNYLETRQNSSSTHSPKMADLLLWMLHYIVQFRRNLVLNRSNNWQFNLEFWKSMSAFTKKTQQYYKVKVYLTCGFCYRSNKYYSQNSWLGIWIHKKCTRMHSLFVNKCSMIMNYFYRHNLQLKDSIPALFQSRKSRDLRDWEIFFINVSNQLYKRNKRPQSWL